MPSIRSTDDEWSRLGLYLSRDVLARRYQDRHGLTLNAAKANEIIAHFDQGQQYFRSSQSAGALAGPLEQYYGVLAFARGLILYLDPGVLEATLKKGHGLRAVMSANSKVEDIEIVVEDGTFNEFLRATKNVAQVTVDSSPKAHGLPDQYAVIRSLPSPQVGSRFYLHELMARMPGIRRHYEEAFGGASCFRCSLWVVLGAIHISFTYERMGLPPIPELAKLLRLHPAFQCLRGDAACAHVFALVPQENPFVTLIPYAMDIDGGDEQAVIAPFPDGWALSEISTYYAAAYAMSMLVRYYPTVWARLLTHAKGDQAFPVLERIRALLQAGFVRLLLEELERSAPQGSLAWPATA